MSQDQEPNEPADDDQRAQEARRARQAEERRLRRFNLDTAICHQINGAALTEYRRAPVRGSAGAPGTYAYQGGLAELTVQLEERGYERHDIVNLPFMINQKLGFAIIFTSGNPFTGVSGAGITPGTRYKKGGVTHHAIMGNHMPGQDVIAPLLSHEQLPGSSEGLNKKIEQLLSGLSVYLYLIHFDWAKREVRSEVSMPAPKQGSEYIEQFLDRNRVSPYLIPSDDVRGDEQEIDFDIE